MTTGEREKDDGCDRNKEERKKEEYRTVQNSTERKVHSRRQDNIMNGNEMDSLSPRSPFSLFF